MIHGSRMTGEFTLNAIKTMISGLWPSWYQMKYEYLVVAGLKNSAVKSQVEVLTRRELHFHSHICVVDSNAYNL